jgi:hypothetical protein
MLFGVWVMSRLSSDIGTEEIVSGAVVLLIIVLLLLGVDPRKPQGKEE